MERLKAVNIVSSYGRKRVLDGVNIDAGEGQCVGIIGANGCGKSTLLNILAGLKKPDSGDIYFDTRLASKRMFIDYTGYVPQENSLIPELCVMDNLRMWYRDKEVLCRELEHGFLHELGIDNMCRTRAGKLSGGMKKRVSIGCALAGNPPVLILDEPEAALDLPGKARIREYLGRYKKLGGTIILATHDEADLDMCDRVFVLDMGMSMEIDRTLRGEELLKKMRQGD